ncbi:hypothetical protein HK097_000729 [Rhizophlyctis rosea]|uniref:Uncharacterized protein n=1 Tax=Rhizophlyctis rosea TaxID=64517 RepID=A0AAD5S7S5_9FUNG|nr:hypothetical protein HK097_000729 [Rhizophlyctis rosea]
MSGTSSGSLTDQTPDQPPPSRPASDIRQRESFYQASSRPAIGRAALASKYSTSSTASTVDRQALLAEWRASRGGNKAAPSAGSDTASVRRSTSTTDLRGLSNSSDTRLGSSVRRSTSTAQLRVPSAKDETRQAASVRRSSSTAELKQPAQISISCQSPNLIEQNSPDPSVDRHLPLRVSHKTGLRAETHQPTATLHTSEPPTTAHTASSAPLPTSTRTDSSPSIPPEEEILAMHTRLLQWIYLRAKAKEAFEEQERQAEKQLFETWQCVSRNKEKLHQNQMMFEQEKNVSMSLRSLQVQEECLMQIVGLVDTIRSEYEDLGESVRSWAVMMPLENVTLPDPGALRDTLQQSASALQDVLEKGEGRIDQFEIMAAKMEELSLLATEERKELEECSKLLEVISMEEVVERSLAIQMVQMTEGHGV